MPEDARSAHDLLERAFRGTAYLLRLREVLDDALRFEDPEYLCLLAESERESALEGLVLFGTILGARLATRVHAVVAPDPRVQLALLDSVRETCVRSRERLVICELPHDTPFDLAWIALVARGYREEGRIEDFVRNGVALRLLVWRPSGEAARA